MSWFALYIKPRNEKKAVKQLQQLGITVYCPMVTEMHQWSDRKKRVEVPLISSYIFVQLEDSERDLVFQAPSVMRYLFWLGKPAIVRDEEIRILQTWLQGNVLDTHVESLQPGDRMNIPNGHFKGKDAVVHQVTKNRVQLILLDLGMKITLTKP